MPQTNDKIEEFWRWILTRIVDLGELVTPAQSLWDEVLVKLRQVDESLRFEISDEQGSGRELIVTAEGNAGSFPVADALVSAAPAIKGWTVISLKPAQGFDFQIDYEGVHLDPRDLWFLPLSSAENPADIGIRVGVPRLSRRKQRATENAVLIILDTGLGERSAALDLQHVEVTELPATPAKEGFRPLVELPAHISERRGRRILQ
jgi:hypothetical protein